MMGFHSNEYRDYVVIENMLSSVVGGSVVVQVFPEKYLEVGESKLVLGDMEDITAERRRFNPADHAVRHGVVRMCNYKKVLEYDGYSIQICVKPGDEVWFDYYSGMNAPLLKYRSGWYYIMRYSDLLVRKREWEVYPLNGYVLCDTIKENIEIGNGITLVMNKPVLFNKAKLTHVGQLPYYEDDFEHIVPPIGAVIYTKKPIIMLEDNLHLFLDGKPHRVLKLDDIDAYEEEA